jgi:hypothetical protein
MRAGVLGGTLFSTLLNLSWDDVIFTIIMAAVGAVVSYIVSLILRWAVKKLNH